MIVSWNWLQEYVPLGMPLGEFTDRLTMSGLNLEGTHEVDGDVAIDLEVTSNRPDCLGHLGVAREVSVLFGGALTVPAAEPSTSTELTGEATAVDIECPDLCPRYIARVIRGVKVASSPDWLVQRLKTLGIAAINNVVDITNYVLLECGQPLHAFDFDKLHGGRIVVRRARAGEKLTAINQREYELDSSMCVIADADHPVAIGGVMGGLETEIGEATVNLLIETADFSALSIRDTARRLNLHSDSSYRFERGVDPEGLDWASRRCCDLILDLAGGELLDLPVIAGTAADGEQAPVTFRFDQIRRILGIEVATTEATEILKSLGLRQQGKPTKKQAKFVPPSWRRDLTREIDLIEEVARIHGYEEIPDNAAVSLTPGSHTRRDRVCAAVRNLLTSAGLFEAVTISFVSDDVCNLFRPRAELDLLRVEHSSRRHENVLRPSLIPSLLVARRENERQGTFNAQLFEISKVYLQAAPGGDENKTEPSMIGMVSGRSFGELKGVVDALAERLNRSSVVTVQPSDVPQFVPGRGAEVLLNGKQWGWLGELDRSVTDRLDLRDTVTVAELDLAMLEATADLTPSYTPLAQFPEINRDLNFVLDEEVSWQQLEWVIRTAGGPLLERVSFGGQYRGEQIGAEKKSYVVLLSFRSPERTLTADEVEAAQQAVVEACTKKLGAKLR